MKKYALWIAEKSATGLIVGVAMAVGVISVAYAASGNGLFADVLNKIVSNGNYQTTDGTVLQATKVLGGTATDLYTSNGTTGEWTGATNVKVGDSDKVDGLHASELAGGLSAAATGGYSFRLLQITDMGSTFSVGGISCVKLGNVFFGDGNKGTYGYRPSPNMMFIAGAGCYNWLYSWSYTDSDMIYCNSTTAYEYLCDK